MYRIPYPNYLYHNIITDKKKLRNDIASPRSTHKPVLY